MTENTTGAAELGAHESSSATLDTNLMYLSLVFDLQSVHAALVTAGVRAQRGAEGGVVSLNSSHPVAGKADRGRGA